MVKRFALLSLLIVGLLSLSFNRADAADYYLRVI